MATISQINEAAKTGKLTQKQAHDLRGAVNDAYSDHKGLTKPDEAILEIDKKVDEATRYYL